MRIRKRFPLSSVASSASDPQLNRLPWVQPPTSQPSDPPTQPLSDQPPTIGADKLDSTWRNNFEIKKKESEKLKLEEASHEAELEEKIRSNNTRKEHNIFAAAPVEETRVLPPLDSDQVGERWFDGDKKIPLKKRKGPVVDKIGSEETLMLEKEKKMKSKTNKKCSTTKVQRNQDNKAENDDNRSTNIGKKTNVKRGSAIMEGSRCSRVNGRGWRCCQQTLVGYSLCEHHLGKGRLRSITSVRGRAKVVPSTVAAATTTIAPHNDTTTTTTDNNVIDVCSDKKDLASSSVVQPAAAAAQGYKEIILLDGNCYDDDEDEEEDEDDDDYNNDTMKKPPVAKKKKMKLGMVKARSLSSLLNQTD